jgi:hypothetical protein
MQCSSDRLAFFGDHGLSHGRWRSVHSYLLLTASTILCLVPFSGRAFNVDDTLFIWAAKNIAQHPLNPYGFQLIWETTRTGMADVTQNPPLASYYAAMLGSVLGWSERTMHLGFLIPTIALVLGTYRLAQKFTKVPLFAAFATLLTPGLLVSASSVMCDTMMVAIWVWASVLWIDGLETSNRYLLIASSALMALSALAKYFGVSLILLVLAYSIARNRRLGPWAWYLLIPIAVLFLYQLWTVKLYGNGLLLGAAEYAVNQRNREGEFFAVKLLLGISYTGGCALTGWLMAPSLGPRKAMLGGLVLGGLASVSLLIGSIDMVEHASDTFTRVARNQHWLLIATQLALCIGGGFFVLSLAGFDGWRERSAESLFLALWIAGTLFFAAFLNWTMNARSVLPLVPAVGILVARQFDRVRPSAGRSLVPNAALALVVSGVVSIWMTAADAELANSARTAATRISEKFQDHGGTVWFGGHWGFQYYMESLGGRAVDWEHPDLAPGDYLVVPHNNAWVKMVDWKYVAAVDTVEVPMHSWASTLSWELGAGFYDYFWGPLPYAVGPVPAERYTVVQLAPSAAGVFQSSRARQGE